MGGFETILYRKTGHLAYITLNRPKVLNIYNVRMRDELYEALSAIKIDTDVHVVTLRGAGDKAFCAGADLGEFLSAPAPTAARNVRWQRDVWGLFLSLSQPVIAALHGYVFGSGIEMALCCDIRIAADDCIFGLPEVALGIIPAAGATQTVPRAIGPGRALDLLLTGRRIGAQEALEMQLVNQVVARADLLPEVEALSEKIVAFDQRAVRAIKRAVSRGLDLPAGPYL
ncbi:MAG: enoyl-CoA hydratase/isomerase family protein [Chloroflexi bacterium]|nr:enoyl-CoA hydratase/isomerase family protein [Chloroflexota bacterium]